MKPEGRKHYSDHGGKHHIKGAPDGGWWIDVIETSKSRANRIALKEMEIELRDEDEN